MGRKTRAFVKIRANLTAYFFIFETIILSTTPFFLQSSFLWWECPHEFMIWAKYFLEISLPSRNFSPSTFFLLSSPLISPLTLPHCFIRSDPRVFRCELHDSEDKCVTLISPKQWSLEEIWLIQDVIFKQTFWEISRNFTA